MQDFSVWYDDSLSEIYIKVNNPNKYANSSKQLTASDIAALFEVRSDSGVPVGVIESVYYDYGKNKFTVKVDKFIPHNEDSSPDIIFTYNNLGIILHMRCAVGGDGRTEWQWWHHNTINVDILKIVNGEENWTYFGGGADYI